MSIIQRKRTESQKEKMNDRLIKRRGELVSQKVSFGVSTAQKEAMAKKMGKGSLKSTGKNEGENMMMGKNNTQRA